MTALTERLPLTDAFKNVIESHLQWLAAVAEPERTERWVRLLQHQPEPAIIEAAIRQILGNSVDRLESNESLSHGGPDYRCHVGSVTFCVECACLTSETVTKHTHLPETANGQAS